jgi:hypothetical protein
LVVQKKNIYQNLVFSYAPLMAIRKGSVSTDPFTLWLII